MNEQMWLTLVGAGVLVLDAAIGFVGFLLIREAYQWMVG